MNLYERLSKENQAKIENSEFTHIKESVLKVLNEKTSWNVLEIHEYLMLCDLLELSYDLKHNLKIWENVENYEITI